MTRINHEKNNKRVNGFQSNLPGRDSPSLGKIKLSEPVVTYEELLKGRHIRRFQEDANMQIKSPKELRLAYQKIACSCLLELGRHRDTRQITHMFNAMPVDFHRDRMEKFLTTFGQLKSTQSEDGNTEFKFDRTKRTLIGHALEQPWWMTRP